MQSNAGPSIDGLTIATVNRRSKVEERETQTRPLS